MTKLRVCHGHGEIIALSYLEPIWRGMLKTTAFFMKMCFAFAEFKITIGRYR